MNKFTDNIRITNRGFITFLLGFSGAFIMVVINLLRIHPFQIISPLVQPESRTQIEKSVTNKLLKIKNTYHLKQTQNFIPKAQAEAPYDAASAYAVVDFDTGEVIESKNLNDRLEIASLTKVMTSIVALDLTNPEDKFTISQKAAKTIPTKIGVVTGQKMKLGELLPAALMTSANDAAQAISDGVNSEYGSQIFVDAMNDKAQALGLSNTHFANPQGFDSSTNYSTVGDLAILAHYALSNYPEIRTITSQGYKFLPATPDHKQFDLYNWNGLIGVYPGANGLKIGNTEEAGYTTIVTAKRNGKEFIVVLLGAPGVRERDLWASALLDYAFSAKANATPANITTAQLDAKYKTWQYWN